MYIYIQTEFVTDYSPGYCPGLCHGCSKKFPCFRGAPRRGEGFTYTMCSKIQAFSLYSTPNKEAMPWINEGEKENCQLSIVNCQLNCSGER